MIWEWNVTEEILIHRRLDTIGYTHIDPFPHNWSRLNVNLVRLRGEKNVEEETNGRVNHRVASASRVPTRIVIDRSLSMRLDKHHGAELRDDILNGKFFYTLRNALVIIET